MKVLIEVAGGNDGLAVTEFRQRDAVRAWRRGGLPSSSESDRTFAGDLHDLVGGHVAA